MAEKNNNVAFVFPGQGSQSVGMLQQLAETHQEVTTLFAQASDVLGYDLWQMISQGPVEELNQTQNTQPAMLAAGVAVWEIWKKQANCLPGWVAGHSLGEYTALVCADAISFETGIALVAERGRLMQEAVPEGSGAMAAVLGLDDAAVIELCNTSAGTEVLSAVNFNAPGQVVIAGNTDAVQRAISAAKDAGAKRALKLPVSVPSHCELMHPAADKLELRLQTIALNPPSIPLIHNVDVLSHNDPVAIKQAIKEQLYKPVRWVDTINHLHQQGVTDFVECGPGKVLMGLNKRIVKSANHYTIYDSDTLHNVLEQIG